MSNSRPCEWRLNIILNEPPVGTHDATAAVDGGPFKVQPAVCMANDHDDSDSHPLKKVYLIMINSKSQSLIKFFRTLFGVMQLQIPRPTQTLKSHPPLIHLRPHAMLWGIKRHQSAKRELFPHKIL